MAPSEYAPLVSTIREDMNAVTIAADLTSPTTVCPFAGTVTAVRYVPTATITGAASPASRTFTLYNRGAAGAGTTVVAQLAMVAGVNAPDTQAKAITLSATPANLVVAQGDILDWESLHIGATGLVDPGGVVEVDMARA